MIKNHSLLFFKKFILNPRNVGSVIPSSRFLANRMVASAMWEQAENIVEIGSGTGAITRVIANKIKYGGNIILFERDEEMGQTLQRDFPHFIRESNALTN
ncbi:rRNA adenine N-6-methyltransferase family protein [Bacillus sp. FJAT-26390]|uniref:rRNA adenine N-6-methyltransferase family protein n=1 Tax=Bacillus sp. FJAT-26390 TaxID=1743142 RepID=UPI0026C3D2E3